MRGNQPCVGHVINRGGPGPRSVTCLPPLRGVASLSTSHCAAASKVAARARPCRADALRVGSVQWWPPTSSFELVEDRTGWQHLLQRHGEARQQNQQQRDSEPVSTIPRFEPCPFHLPMCSPVVLLAYVLACRVTESQVFGILLSALRLTGSCTTRRRLVLFEFSIVFDEPWCVLERASREDSKTRSLGPCSGAIGSEESGGSGERSERPVVHVCSVGFNAVLDKENSSHSISFCFLAIHTLWFGPARLTVFCQNDSRVLTHLTNASKQVSTPNSMRASHERPRASRVWHPTQAGSSLLESPRPPERRKSHRRSRAACRAS